MPEHDSSCPVATSEREKMGRAMRVRQATQERGPEGAEEGEGEDEDEEGPSRAKHNRRAQLVFGTLMWLQFYACFLYWVALLRCCTLHCMRLARNEAIALVSWTVSWTVQLNLCSVVIKRTMSMY